MPESDASSWTEDVTPVDVTLKNTGDTPLHFTRIETEVLSVEDVNCSRQGGGTIVSAYYKVQIPNQAFTAAGQKQESTGQTITSDIDFTVKPQSTDRMVITVGPEQVGNGGPVVVAVKMRLVPESGDPVELEPLALGQPDRSTSAAKTASSTDPVEIECMQEKSAILADMFSRTKTQSPELIALKDAYAGAS